MCVRIPAVKVKFNTGSWMYKSFWDRGSIIIYYLFLIWNFERRLFFESSHEILGTRAFWGLRILVCDTARWWYISKNSYGEHSPSASTINSESPTYARIIYSLLAWFSQSKCYNILSQTGQDLLSHVRQKTWTATILRIPSFFPAFGNSDARFVLVRVGIQECVIGVSISPKKEKPAIACQDCLAKCLTENTGNRIYYLPYQDCACKHAHGTVLKWTSNCSAQAPNQCGNSRAIIIYCIFNSHISIVVVAVIYQYVPYKNWHEQALLTPGSRFQKNNT